MVKRQILYYDLLAEGLYLKKVSRLSNTHPLLHILNSNKKNPEFELGKWLCS